MPLRSKGFCLDFAKICVAEITFVFCWLCYLAKHWQHTKVTTEFPILLRQLLSLCCEHLQAAKTAVVSGRRDWTGLGILSPPGSQHVALGAHTSMGQPTGGILHPSAMGGSGSTGHLPPAFPGAPGNISNTPCYDFLAVEVLAVIESQAWTLSVSSLHKVTFSCCSVSLVSALIMFAPFIKPACAHLPHLLYRILTQGDWSNFAWAARKQIFLNFNKVDFMI